MGSVMNNELNPQVSQIHVGTQAATASLPGLVFRKKSRIKSIQAINQSAIAADNTNYLQLSVKSLADVEYAELDTRAAHENGLVALTPKALNKASALLAVDNSGELEVAAGTTLKVVATKNGTGVPTEMQLVVEWYPL